MKHCLLFLIICSLLFSGCQFTADKKPRAAYGFTENPKQINIISNLLLAEIALQNRNLKDAYSLYSKLAYDSKDINAYNIAYSLGVKENDLVGTTKLAYDWHKSFPNNINALKAAALADLQNSNIDSFIEKLTKLEKLQKTPLDAEFLSIYADSGSQVPVIILNKLLKSQPMTSRKLLWARFFGIQAAELLTKKGKFIEANKLLTTLIKTQAKDKNHLKSIHKNSLDIIYTAKLNLQILQTGIPNFNKFEIILKNQPTFSSLRLKLAEQYSLIFSTSNLAQAKKHLQILIKNKATTADIYETALLLAANLQIQLNYPALLKPLAIKYKENILKFANIKAEIQHRQYNYKNAVSIYNKLYDKVNRKYHKYITTRLVKSLQYIDQKQTLNTIKSLKTTDNNIDNIVIKAEMLHSIGQYKSSQEITQKWLDINLKNNKKPYFIKHQQAIMQLFILHASNAVYLGQVSGMQTSMEVFIETYPQSNTLLNSFGFMLADANIELEKAKELLTEALKNDPSNPAIIDSMGWLLFRMGKLDAAVKYLLPSYRLIPADETASHLADVYWKLGKKTQAIQIWKWIELTQKNSSYLKNSDGYQVYLQSK